MWSAFLTQLNFRDTLHQKGGMLFRQVTNPPSSNKLTNPSHFSVIVEGVEARQHSRTTRHNTHQENANPRV